MFKMVILPKMIIIELTSRKRVIHDKKNKISIAEVFQKYSRFGLDKSKISRWLNQKDTVLKNVVGETKNMFKVRPAKKHNELFKDIIFGGKKERT